jgi:hypothetical protein
VASEPERSSPHSKEPARRLYLMFRNKLIFYGGRLLAPAQPRNLSTAPVCCPRLLIQRIRSYPPYLVAFSSIRNLRTRHAVATVDPLYMGREIIHAIKCTCSQNLFISTIISVRLKFNIKSRIVISEVSQLAKKC